MKRYDFDNINENLQNIRYEIVEALAGVPKEKDTLNKVMEHLKEITNLLSDSVHDPIDDLDPKIITELKNIDLNIFLGPKSKKNYCGALFCRNLYDIIKIHLSNVEDSGRNFDYAMGMSREDVKKVNDKLLELGLYDKIHLEWF